VLPRPAEAVRADTGPVPLVLASLAVLLAAADTYVVVLALPDIMSGVGLGLGELQRGAPIVSAFLLGYVAVLPLLGRLADLLGRVPVLVGCLAVFAIGSLCTASAHDLGLVVAGRALQGVGGGGLVPATLALVADRYPPDRRGVPLGVVGAVQEVGSVLGPLFGGLVLAVSGWRTIFWANLVAAVVLAAGLLATSPRRRVRPDLAVVGAVATAGLVLVVVEPDRLTSGVTSGRAYLPLVASVGWSTPLLLLTVAATALLVALVWDGGAVRRVLGGADVVGALLLGVALSGVVLAFAAADPSRQVVADRAPLLLTVTAVAAVLFVVRQRLAPEPLVPRGTLAQRPAWGALAVNLLVGAALVAALVDVPVFARATSYPGDQLGAALVLVRLLAALPVGAVAGGWLCGRLPPRTVAAGGMALAALGLAAMARWPRDALDGPLATLALVGAGLGFGLAVAPVNVALLAATRSAVHGVASALTVVARMVGMLVGLSVLTAVGLRAFYVEQARLGSPLDLCPTSPSDCPAYTDATASAVLAELHLVFAGAAGCALAAAALAAVLLTRPRT
jgi:MFS family permease